MKKGDKVRFKKHNKLDDGIVCGLTSEPRSYVVRNAHGHIRRNRRHLFQMPKCIMLIVLVMTGFVTMYSIPLLLIMIQLMHPIQPHVALEITM